MSSTHSEPLSGKVVEPPNPQETVRRAIRTMLGASGLISLAVGVLILAAPLKTAMVVAGFIAVYAVIAGLVNLALGIFSGPVGFWVRLGYAVLGVVFIVAGGVALANLSGTAEALGMVLGIVVGVVWIIEGVVGLTMLGDVTSKLWTILYAAVSVIAGIVLVTSPLWAVSVLWLLMGISLVLIGLLQVVRAIRFGAGAK